MKNKTFKFILIAVMAAISYVLMLIEFPLLPSSYLRMDFSDIPAIITGVIAGPIGAVLVELLKNIIELLTKGLGTTLGFGNILNFLVGIGFAVPFCIIYNKTKEKGRKQIIIGGLLSSVCMIAIGFLGNFLFTPFYFKYVVGQGLTFAQTLPLAGTASLFNVIKSAIIIVVLFILLPLVEKPLKKVIDKIK